MLSKSDQNAIEDRRKIKKAQRSEHAMAGIPCKVRKVRKPARLLCSIEKTWRTFCLSKW